VGVSSQLIDWNVALEHLAERVMRVGKSGFPPLQGSGIGAVHLY